MCTASFGRVLQTAAMLNVENVRDFPRPRENERTGDQRPPSKVNVIQEGMLNG